MPTGRSDAPAGMEVYAESRAYQLRNQDPSFHYQWASKDPAHPQYVGNYLRRREIGNQATGYTIQDPWEVVQEGTVEQGRKRADDGKAVDTSVTNGSLVLIRTPKANAERAHFLNDRMCVVQDAALLKGDRGAIDKTLCGYRVQGGDALPTSAQLTGGK